MRSLRHKRFFWSVFTVFAIAFTLSYMATSPLKEDYKAASAFFLEKEETQSKNYFLMASASQTRGQVKRKFFSPVQSGKRTELFSLEARKSVLSWHFDEKAQKLKTVELCQGVQGIFRGGKSFLPLHLPKGGELFQVVEAENATLFLSDQLITLKNISAKAEFFKSKETICTFPLFWKASALNGVYKEGKWSWQGDEIRLYSSFR